MSIALVWPGKYFFYPIGNTSAVSLTRDLGPEEPANVLLLGCGDPRKVLYTIFCEPLDANRSLDFTCNDYDPAIFARNALLFTMLADEHPITTIWNIFFHMHLDKSSYDVLKEQCRKLIQLSSSTDDWIASPYSRFLTICTEYTLSEMRRHWSLYVNMHNLPPEQLKKIRDAFAVQFRKISQELSVNLSSARSAGPLMANATENSSTQFKKYWTKGTTLSDTRDITAASLLNPTFAYSLGGEGFCVQYGIDPLVTFHLAPLYGNAEGHVTVADTVTAAKAEFQEWCSAFQASLSRPVTCPTIRLFQGEATAVCRVMRTCGETGSLESSVPVMQWRGQLIRLSERTYQPGGAPLRFNVIDTSNLDDDIGLLNCLLAAIPLLASRSSVVYTESLLYRGQDARKEFVDRLYADLTLVGVLLGLCPVDYVSGFATRCNTRELQMHKAYPDSAQFHQATTWKSPVAGDPVAVRGLGKPPALVFDPAELGKVLFDMYRRMFEQEDPKIFLQRNQGNLKKAFSRANIAFYTRESFVLLLRLVKDKLRIQERPWLQIMTHFSTCLQSMPLENFHMNDFAVQMHRHGVQPKDGHDISLVRVFLTVPRQNLWVLPDNVEKLGTVPLQCDIRGGNQMRNIFLTVHVAFGKVIPEGIRANPQIIFDEDPEGWKGSSALIASFIMPASLLTAYGSPEGVTVGLSTWSTPITFIALHRQLGEKLVIFSARLTDKSHVHILPEQPRLSTNPPSLSSPVPMHNSSQIGEMGPTSVELDGACEVIKCLTTRLSVVKQKPKVLLESGAMPQVAQVSSCMARIAIGSYTQTIVYPFPILGSEFKVRIARKSHYIEVIVPLSGPFQADGMKLHPFPVISTPTTSTSWNIHAVNLARLPVLNLRKRSKTIESWLTPHIDSQMSARELSLRKKQRDDALMHIKDSIGLIFGQLSGAHDGVPRRVFTLGLGTLQDCDTVFLIKDLRFDLQFHTMVCDGFVLRLKPNTTPEINAALEKLLGSGDVVHISANRNEMRTWKQILPALVERCRSSWQHGPNCEHKSRDQISALSDAELDPLCSCGKGKDADSIAEIPLWNELAPYTTRFALSPLFGVSYLEVIGRDPDAHKCFVCKEKASSVCEVCKKVRYCGRVCQMKDWKNGHRSRCKQ